MKKIIAAALALVTLASATVFGVFAQNAKIGDVNGDGKINSGDALAVLQYATGIVKLSSDALTIADVSADKKVNSADALMILQYATGIIKTFPAESQKDDDKIPESKAEILAFYKDIAKKNSDVSCYQAFNLKKINLGSTVISSILTPMIKDVISSNSKDIPRFPGDMNVFCEDDIISAAFKKADNGNVTITLKLKDQTDGLEGEKYEGTVGHGIGVVGNVPQLLKDNNVTIADISKASGEITYTNAVITITADKDGMLIKGGCKWSYTATAWAKNVKIQGMTMKNADGVVDYSLTY